MIAVVDASVALKWVIPEVLSVQADRLRDRADRLIAPDLLLVEAANALWKKTSRRELSLREAERALDLLAGSGMDLRPSSPLLRRALRLAGQLRHPVYDCLYLTLAQAEGATLVTADQRLLTRVSRRRNLTVLDLAAI